MRPHNPHQQSSRARPLLSDWIVPLLTHSKALPESTSLPTIHESQANDTQGRQRSSFVQRSSHSRQRRRKATWTLPTSNKKHRTTSEYFALDSGGFEDYGNGGLRDVETLKRPITVGTAGPNAAIVKQKGTLSFTTIGRFGQAAHWVRTRVLQNTHIPLGSRLLSERLTQLGGFDQIKPAWSDTAEFYDGGKFVYVGGKHVGSAKWCSEKQLYVMELADNQSTHETRSFTTHTHSSLMAKPKGNSLIPRVDKDVLHARFTCAATVWDPSTSHDDSDGSTPLHDPRRCKTSTCFICKMAKSKRSPITRAGTPIDRSSDGFKPGQHLYWDPMGRLAEDTIEGHKYFVMSGDCTTKYQCITMTSAKSDFLDALVEFLNHTETQSGNKCQMLTCDNELAHHTKFIALTKQRGFEVDLTEVGRSDQNPFAESANATIQKDIRVLLLLGRQPQNMASYAARYALYVRNRTPDRPDGTSRLERLTGRPQRVDHIRVYGCLVIYHVRGRGGDFTSRGRAGTFVGIQGKHYLIFDNDSMQLKRVDIIRTNSVAFVERRPGWLVTNAQLAQERRIHLSDDGTLPWADQLFTSFPWNELTAAPEHTLLAREPSDLYNVADEHFPAASIRPMAARDGRDLQVSPTTSVTRPEELEHDQPLQPAPRLPDGSRGYFEERESQDDEDYFRERGEVLERGIGTPGTRRSGRTSRAVPSDHATHATRTSHTTRAHELRADYNDRQILTPCFLSREVSTISPEDTESWALADQREWDGIAKKGVMSIVSDSEPQPGESVLPSRMIRVEKPQHPKSSPKHYKSRLCVQDLKCIYQHSQDQTYSPTPTQEAGRLLTWYAATHRERIWSMDCVQAYLNTPAPSRKGQRIFIRFPKGHERPGCLMLLHRYLYGLQKAAQMWHKYLITTLKDAGFRQLTTEPCILIHRGDSKSTMVEVRSCKRHDLTCLELST